MPKVVAVSALKTHCLRLVEEVARQRQELIVTKRGKPIVRVVPVGKQRQNQALGRLRGTLVGGEKVEDFDTGTEWEARRR